MIEQKPKFPLKYGRRSIDRIKPIIRKIQKWLDSQQSRFNQQPRMSNSEKLSRGDINREGGGGTDQRSRMTYNSEKLSKGDINRENTEGRARPTYRYRRSTQFRRTSLGTLLARRWQYILRRYPNAVLITALAMGLIAAIILIPGILVRHIDPSATTGNGVTADPNATVQDVKPLGDLAEQITTQGRPLSFPIYLKKEDRIQSVTLEQYVRGVVAAEMPIEFELEALKAQAIAARTYIIKRFVDKDVSNVPVKGAWVTDSVQHQAYLTDEAILSKWDNEQQRVANLRKLNQAVSETSGQIITYKGAPILAAFFSTSNGHTENSEQYWSEKLPYLRSVDSPWEADISPKFKSQVTFSAKEFARKLGVSEKAVTVSASLSGTKKRADATTALPIRILEKSAGGRIAKITIAGKTFTGRDVREKLGLASSEFNWQAKGAAITLTVYGNGHGVGMSQWGAQGMALKGFQAEDILKHYYTGVTIEKFLDLSTIL